MCYWKIKAYSKDGKTIASDVFFVDIPVKAEVEIETRLRYLQTQKIWKRPYAAKLKRGIKDILEVRVKSNRVQYRPLGFFGPQKKEFTLLIAAVEKDYKFVPVNADKTAEKRKQSIINGEKHAIDYF